MNNSKNVPFYIFGENSLSELKALLDKNRKEEEDYCIFFVDIFFRNAAGLNKLHVRNNDLLFYVDSKEEPSTDSVNQYYKEINSLKDTLPCTVVGMGGGSTLDTAKAISNLLTNEGNAEDYQGWDLVNKPGIYKIGIPTISGTGAESSRTCVMMNKKKNLKLGMNSEYTIFDQLILDPALTVTVEPNQYFYTGMDTYIHCIESLSGSFRHQLADAFSTQALKLTREVFSSNDMKSADNREKLMTASYLGGSALANTFVGVVHPFSAGLSIVLDLHHCYANCIVMNVIDEFYPEQTKEFHTFMDKQKITLLSNITADLNEEDFNNLYLSTIIHEKPLINALGEDYKTILTKEKVIEIFRRM